MIFTLIFWASVILLAHSYLLYPIIIQLIAQNRSLSKNIFKINESLPFVSIVLSAHNEEKVIAEKIKSILHTSYPLNKIELIIGSDNSEDSTNRICEIYEKNYENILFLPFQKRRGKPAVINELIAKSRGSIIIITDANVFFKHDTIF
ncbi:MAG: glycosyltransferase, partial [Bacteroidales bacterium]